MQTSASIEATIFRLADVGKTVGCSVVEAFGDKPKPQELEQVLRLEYRSKLLNPKVAIMPPYNCNALSAVSNTM